MRLTWLGHSSVKIETGNKLIYIDPYAGDEDWYSPASLILISRFDYDHCSMEKVKKMILDNTKVIGTAEVAANLYPCDTLHVGEQKIIDGIEVIGMPVIDARTGEKENAIGFLIIAENKRIFYMSDSAYEPEMNKANPDVLLIAVGGIMSLDREEAAKVTEFLKPKITIPIHWGAREGTKDDAIYFKEITKVPVKILERGESIEI